MTMKDFEKLMNKKALEKVAEETGNKYLEKVAKKHTQYSKSEQKELRSAANKGSVKGMAGGAVSGGALAGLLADKRKKTFSTSAAKKGALAGGLIYGLSKARKAYNNKKKEIDSKSK